MTPSQIASVPGLPSFDLPFAFTTAHGTEDRRSSAPVYYCERKRKVKTGEAWEQGYFTDVLRIVIVVWL